MTGQTEQLSRWISPSEVSKSTRFSWAYEGILNNIKWHLNSECLTADSRVPLLLFRYFFKDITNPTTAPQRSHILLSPSLSAGGQGPSYRIQEKTARELGNVSRAPLTFSSTTSTVLSTLEMSQRLYRLLCLSYILTKCRREDTKRRRGAHWELEGPAYSR